MGKATNFVVVAAIGVTGFIAAMEGIGSNLESEFAANPIASAAAPEGPMAVTSQALTPAPQPQAPRVSEGERIALVESDPKMKAASDFVGTLINLNGHLCARVTNVVPVGDSEFRVTCVEHSDGNGRASYLVNGETNSATPL